MATTVTYTGRPKAISISAVGTVEMGTLLNAIRMNKLENHEGILRNWPEPSTTNAVYLALTATASPFMAAQKVKNCFDNFSYLDLAAGVTAAANAGDATFTIVATL
jgi:hypothetical protein